MIIIAKVSKAGYVTAKKPGNTFITAKVKETKLKATIAIAVE